MTEPDVALTDFALALECFVLALRFSRSRLARLIARLSLKYDIPIDRKHINGHYQAPGCSGNGGGFTCHTDPGEGFRWRFLLSQARKFRREMNS